MTYQVTISTKRFLRKPKIETFTGAWHNEDAVKRVTARYRPKAEILEILEVTD